MYNEVNDLFLCECHNNEHQMIFSYDQYEGDPTEYDNVYVSIHLTDCGFWHRLKYGLKYIFGYKSKYGAFDEIILRPEDWEKLDKAKAYLRELYLLKKEAERKENENGTELA